jgi:hypothetical protein
MTIHFFLEFPEFQYTQWSFSARCDGKQFQPSVSNNSKQNPFALPRARVRDLNELKPKLKSGTNIDVNRLRFSARAQVASPNAIERLYSTGRARERLKSQLLKVKGELLRQDCVRPFDDVIQELLYLVFLSHYETQLYIVEKGNLGAS